MTIFDRRVPIHETSDGIGSMNTLVQELGIMLERFDIEHCFAYAVEDEIAKVKEDRGKDLLCWLYYESSQNTAVTLLISLFVKLYLKKDDNDILAAIVKSMADKKVIS